MCALVAKLAGTVAHAPCAGKRAGPDGRALRVDWLGGSANHAPVPRPLPLGASENLNTIDLTLALLLAYSTWRGYRRGVLSTLASIVAPVAGFLAATHFASDLALVLGVYVEAPESFLGFAAVPLTFLLVAGGVRIAAAIASAILGLGDSLISSILGAVAGVGAAGLLLGASVLVLHHFAANLAPADEPGVGVLTSRARSLLVAADQQLGESVLAPRLASITEQALGTIFEDQPPLEGLGLDKHVDEAAAAAASATSAARAANLIPPDAPVQRDGEP